MSGSAYPVAHAVAPTVHEHCRRHRDSVAVWLQEQNAALLPDPHVIEAIIDAAFWTSLRREEGYVPKISLAFVPPRADVHPLLFAQPIPLDPTRLTRLAPAVDRPGMHLGVWPDADRLMVWGTTGTIPALCFVTEVVAPGLLVVKHRPRSESRKFVNVAVLEGDRMKIIDEGASSLPDCPQLLTSLLGFDAQDAGAGPQHLLVQLAVSMRRHGRGGTLLVVPSGTTRWEASIVHPILYAVEPPYPGLAALAATASQDIVQEWDEPGALLKTEIGRAVDTVAGLTAVDGATVMSNAYHVLAFGAKIGRRDGGAQVEEVTLTEPIEGDAALTVHPGQVGGTRHLSAAQFVLDQPDAIALVASQDGRFTIFAWSPCAQRVYAHRVEALLM